MNWLKNIQETIDYIEVHIKEKLTVDDLASRIYVSAFYLQKMFSLICGIALGEYIRNRRMTLAGYDIVDGEDSILDIALSYDYETNESFTRAFTRFHGVTPSEARKNHSNLNTFSKISVQKKLSGGKIFMSELSERGYSVKEAGSIYYTKNMDRTVEWFEKTLGWYGQIDLRNEENEGVYGCVDPLPLEIAALHMVPFTGMHLFYGEPSSNLVGFMQVTGIQELHEFVKKSGWNQISDVKEEAWGGKSCEVTTIDGGVIRFFELV